MEPVILESARKHGVADDDMLHAWRNPVRIHDLDDMQMFVGPSRAANLLEIGVVSAVDFDGTLIVHAMPARLQFL